LLAAAAAAISPAVRAQVAILESVAGSVRDGVWRLRFRTGPAAKMRVAKSTLLIHLADGESPQSIDVLKPLKGRVAPQPQRDGWITVQLDARCAQRLVDGETWLEFRASPNTAFHLPSQTGFAPYLVVEGK
jgi:hypothetical protein